MSHALIHNESGERFSTPEGRAGYALLDPSGQKIGSIVEVFVNGGGEPEYVRVKVKAGFLKSKTVMIPVSFAEVDDQLCTLTLK